MIINGKKQWLIDEFLSNFNKIETIDLQVIDESIILNTDVEIDLEEIEDTFSILNSYVDKIEIPEKPKVIKELLDLYFEAMQLNKE
jgi:hypothetical protein